MFHLTSQVKLIDLRKHNYHLYQHLKGGGEEKQKLVRLANQAKVNCEFKGNVNDQEKWIEIKKSMFMVFPTSFEGFGMPPMEALYCEIPCICTDIPILKEVYQDKIEYFKENNVNDLCKKIEFLIKNKKYREKSLHP